MNTRRPKIGITGPDNGGTASWLFTALIILLEGGIPVRIRPSKPRHIDALNAIILGGGADIDPQAYEEKGFIETYFHDSHQPSRQHMPFWKKIIRFLRIIVHSLVYFIRKLYRTKQEFGLDKNRDRMEFNMLSHAIQHNLPVLGICRGMQLINVFF